jgi:hypothetical protein
MAKELGLRAAIIIGIANVIVSTIIWWILR